MAQSNHLANVAIVGATGRIGGYFAEALVKTGKHFVTAITREGSKGKLPEGVQAAPVNYDDEASLVAAFKGHSFVAITLSVSAPPELHGKIVQAAAKAGVPYIMPNAYGADIFNTALMEGSPLGAAYKENYDQITRAGASFVGMCCGFWYEWSLALGEPWFGFNIKDRTVTFFDDGKVKINVSTWQRCGEALAAFLSLPASGASPSVADWKNNALYFDSFKVSQRDMLDSLHRVLGTTDKDWTITNEATDVRLKRGWDALKGGDMSGFATVLYTRNFFPDAVGDYETKRGLINDKLGFPKEDLDTATKRTVEMVESGWNPFAG